MARTPESPQPNPRIAEVKQRLFGDEDFQKANPQMQTAMALIAAHGAVYSFLARPTEEKELAARVAADVLRECIDTFAREYPNYETTYCGSSMVLENRRASSTP